jgi:hypothetical protein
VTSDIARALSITDSIHIAFPHTTLSVTILFVNIEGVEVAMVVIVKVILEVVNVNAAETIGLAIVVKVVTVMVTLFPSTQVLVGAISPEFMKPEAEYPSVTKS